MGDRMTAPPTPETEVWQGVANPPEIGCPTTPPLKGGGGGVARLTPMALGWGNQSKKSEQ